MSSTTTPEALIAPLVTFSLAVAILTRSPRNRLYQIFALLCLATGTFYLCTTLENFGPQLPWTRLGQIALGGVSLMIYHFFSRFPESLKIRNAKEDIFWLLCFFGIIGVGFLPPTFFEARLPLFNVSATEVVVDLLVAGALWRGISLLLKQYQQTFNPIRQARLRILLVCGYLTCTCLALEKLPLVPALGHVAVTIFLYFLYQALLQYRLLDLKEILARGWVLALQTLILSGVFLTLFFLTGFYELLPERSTQHFIFNIFVAVGIMIIIDEPLKKIFAGVARNIFFHHHFAFENLIEKVRDQLPSKVNEDEAVSFILKSLQTSGRVSNASIYLYEDTSNVLRLKTKFGETESLPQVIADSRWISYLQKNGKPLILDNLQRKLDETQDVRKPMLENVLQNMAVLDAQLALPLMSSSGAFTGVLLIRDRGVDEAFSKAEIRLLMTLAGQMATTLRSLQLYNRFVDRDRLVELGEMAAGLAHEIRNPLGAIKGAAQFLNVPKVELHSHESPQKFLDIIVEEVDRLNRVVEQFLQYARSETRPQSEGNLNQILEHTAKLLTVNGFNKSYQLKMALDPHIPALPMDAERLKQVFLNLSINALQAMPKGGTLHIQSRLAAKGEAEIEFSDTGGGLKSSEVNKIFAPFYTTKDNGSGLGLAICKRIIEDHGGRIEVEPKGPHGGAAFRVRIFYAAANSSGDNA